MSSAPAARVPLADPRALVDGQDVEEDDVAGSQLRDQKVWGRRNEWEKIPQEGLVANDYLKFGTKEQDDFRTKLSSHRQNFEAGAEGHCTAHLPTARALYSAVPE